MTWPLNSLSTPTFVLGTTASSIVSAGPNTASTVPALVTVGLSTISCFFVKQPDGTYTAGGSFVDGAGVTFPLNTVNFADPCGIGGCIFPYISAVAAASTTTGNIASFLAVEADSP